MGRARLFISAGDPSGDQAVARVIAELKNRFPELETVGLGGPRLAELGQHQLADQDEISVMGFWEVAKRFGFFRRLMQTCVSEIEKQRPNAVLLVDYPGFNLRLAKRIKKLGIPILYYISPQVWAWGKGRLPDIRRLIDRVLVILPFEEQFFRENGVDAAFVGHYLMEDIPAEYVGTNPPGNKQLAVLPGSRVQEISRMLPSMLLAAAEFNRRHGWTAVVAARRGVCDYEKLCAPYAHNGVTVVYNDARRVVFESDLALTASGTATLEIGIIGRPMIVVYRTGWLTYQIARRLVKLDRIALINLVLGEKVIPELIQSEVTPQRMTAELERYREPDYHNSVREQLKRVPSLLGGVGASERTAAEVARYL